MLVCPHNGRERTRLRMRAATQKISKTICSVKETPHCTIPFIWQPGKDETVETKHVSGFLGARGQGKGLTIQHFIIWEGDGNVLCLNCICQNSSSYPTKNGGFCFLYIVPP